MRWFLDLHGLVQLMKEVFDLEDTSDEDEFFALIGRGGYSSITVGVQEYTQHVHREMDSTYHLCGMPNSQISYHRIFAAAEGAGIRAIRYRSEPISPTLTSAPSPNDNRRVCQELTAFVSRLQTALPDFAGDAETKGIKVNIAIA